MTLCCLPGCLVSCDATPVVFRYKPDNVLFADTFINASRFAAVAARKLARDSKSESLDCTQMHALLQVSHHAAIHAAVHAAVPVAQLRLAFSSSKAMHSA